MPSSDALVLVNDWISEYYFTSDEASGSFLAATKNLVKEWKAETEGLTGWESPLARFTGHRQAILSTLIELHEQAQQTGPLPQRGRQGELAVASQAAVDQILEVLGYLELPYTDRTVEGGGALRLYTPSGLSEPSVAVIGAVAAETAEELLAKNSGLLTGEVRLDDDDDAPVISTVSDLLSQLATRDDAPKYMVVLAGRVAVLTSDDGWPQGRYLSIDLQTVAERGDAKSGGEIQRTVACLSAPSVLPDASGSIWWNARREESVRNAVGVSKDLRDGVRQSIEIIANEVVQRRKAQGLPPMEPRDAQVLAIQSLRYLYRILFLLYAEASPELGVVPAGDPEYESGYSVDRLRELTLKHLTSASTHGTHFYESLGLLFQLVENGHKPQQGAEEDRTREGLTFEELRSDLFQPKRTALIDQVKLGNRALQTVLQHLLLTKERRGKERGFISYVALGINQLGAVYESLMSYTGSFAQQRLIEVARHGDPSDGSWVIPEDRLDDELREHVVMDRDDNGREVPRTYEYGQFVFRLSGRQRQQSASYYSPEELTRFTVQQGLAELLADDPSAEEILSMTVCEPALGSGAFAIEAVRQLAEAYLDKRQAELRESGELGRAGHPADIAPEDHAAQLQKVKAYIALHNVYGVDLNPTAVELAEVSLWLDTMSRGLKAPWFGLRLRSGNSLIGARRAVYDPAVIRKTKPKDWMTTAARDVALTRSVDGTTGIFHFLLPAEGWGAAGENKEIKTLAPERAKQLRAWAKSVRAKPSAAQVKELSSLTDRVDYLWGLAARRMQEAERQSRRSIDVWGADVPAGGEITREEIENSLTDPNSAYRRLRLVMDAWCALWFWPVQADDADPGTSAVPSPPTFGQWLATIRRIVGDGFSGKKARQAEYFGDSATEWDHLEQVEGMFSTEGCVNIDKLLAETPWLKTAQEIAKEQRFFHWELDFAAVFAREGSGRGGFDLQVGNPPWVRPTLDVAALLGESDPWWTLTDKPSEAAKKSRRPATLSIEGAAEILLLGSRDTESLAEFVGAVSEYPHLVGTQPDLYRAFMVQTWRHSSDRGVTTLIHPPTHLTDARAYPLRRATYRHLRRHWNFINEAQLFAEIHDLVSYSINVYGAEREPSFLNAVSMYHPATVIGSLAHNGDGPEPGFKHDGGWDMRPHASRIARVDTAELTVWHQLMESGKAAIPVDEARMVSTVNRSAAEVLKRLTKASTLGQLEPAFSRGWDETYGRRDAYFESRWGEADSWQDVILQGPLFHVGNPFYAARNSTMKGNQDYSSVDLERLPGDALPITEYKPIHQQLPDGSPDTSRYDHSYGSWSIPNPDSPGETKNVPVRNHYRVMWRAMAAGTGERTLIPAIFPPGVGTVNSVFCEGFPSQSPRELALAAGSMGSLLSDLLIRATVGSGIYQQAVDRLPRIPADHPLAVPAVLRILRLNCLTEAYADLWEQCWDPAMAADAWTGGLARPNRPGLGGTAGTWSEDVPLRLDEDRRQALVELDAIMALVTGVSIDELCTVYRTQFGVLHTYERGEDKRAKIYDAEGRLIPSTVRTAWNKAGRPETGLAETERTYVNPSGRTITAPEPFRILDREADMRHAYAQFQARMNNGHESLYPHTLWQEELRIDA